MDPEAPPAVDYSVLNAFDQGIKRPRTSVFYLGAMVLVAFTMLLLPLIYLAIVVATAWLVYYHAAHNWAPIMDLGDIRGGRIMIMKFVLYITPIIVGAVVVFFLFKPLFARAFDKQTETLLALAAPLNVPADPPAAAPESKAGLRLQTQPKSPGEQPDLKLLEEQNKVWLADYRRRLDELILAAIAVDSIPA